MKRFFSVFLLVLLIADGCSGKPSKPVKPVLKVGTDNVDAVILEQEPLNVPYWLEQGANRRTLVRVSALDGMEPLNGIAQKSLKELADRMDLPGLVDKGNALNPESSYNSASMVSLAKELGIVNEVYWVIPKLQSIDEQDLIGFKDFMKKRLPENSVEIDSIKLNGKVAEGKVAAMPVKIMSLQDLPHIDKPVLLQVDLSFFSEIYRDEKSTRVLSLVSAFVNTLKEKNLSADHVTISLSNAGGVPLKMRFVGGYLSQLLKEPGMTAKEPPALWSQRAYAWKVSQESPKRAVSVYKNIIKENPKDAATRYDLSEAYFQAGDLENCKNELSAAAAIDPGFILGYREFASRLAQSENR